MLISYGTLHRKIKIEKRAPIEPPPLTDVHPTNGIDLTKDCITDHHADWNGDATARRPEYEFTYESSGDQSQPGEILLQHRYVHS